MVHFVRRSSTRAHGACWRQAESDSPARVCGNDARGPITWDEMAEQMRAVLRRLHSPDADPLNEFAPDDPESFAIFVQALVGPEGSEGEESFGFTVCTA